MLSIIFFLVNIFSLLPTITLGNPLPLPPLSQIPQTSPIPAAENDNLQALDYDNVDTAQDYDQLWSTVSGLLSDGIPEKNLFFDMCVLKEVSVLQCLCFSSWLTVDKTRFWYLVSLMNKAWLRRHQESDSAIASWSDRIFTQTETKSCNDALCWRAQPLCSSQIGQAGVARHHRRLELSAY